MNECALYPVAAAGLCVNPGEDSWEVKEWAFLHLLPSFGCPSRAGKMRQAQTPNVDSLEHHSFICLANPALIPVSGSEISKTARSRAREQNWKAERVTLPGFKGEMQFNWASSGGKGMVRGLPFPRHHLQWVGFFLEGPCVKGDVPSVSLG